MPDRQPQVFNLRLLNFLNFNLNFLNFDFLNFNCSGKRISEWVGGNRRHKK